MKINKNFFKKNKNFVYQKKFHALIILNKKYDSASLQSLIANPDYYLEHSEGPFFKSEAGDTTTIGVVKLKDQKIVIKRYNIKSFWHSLKKCCFKSRAWHSWQNIYKLQQIGVETVAPVALIENRWGLLCNKAYLLTEYADNSIRGCDYFGKDASPKDQWQVVVRNISIMAAKLKKALLHHRDFQYGNIIIRGEQPLLLDLDHMREYRRNTIFFRRSFKKDIQHFLDFVKPNHVAYSMFQNEFKRNQLL